MIKEAKYIKGLTNLVDRPTDLPSILLMGRSNVGKSSFINALTNRKELARVSQSPGKTITLNYYLINDSFYLVDAPGYGYAKRSKSMQDNFITMIEHFLMDNEHLKFVCLLIDFKVGPTALDLETYDFLKSLNKVVYVIATKKDKVPTTRRLKQQKLILEAMHQPAHFFSVSNTTKMNINELTKSIVERINTHE